MKEQLEQLKNKVLEEIKLIQDPKLLGNLEKEYLGRKGKLTKVMRQIKDVSAELRPVMGKLVNEIKKDVSAAFQEADRKSTRLNSSHT